MDENKNLENLEAEETVEEVIEETTEVAEETIEAAEEAIETAEEATEEAIETCECGECHCEPETIKKSSKVGAIVAVIVAAVVVAAAVITSNMDFNKYNKMGYVNVSGTTVGEQIAYANMTLEDFLTQGGLPEDMTEDTYWDAAIALMPMENFSKLMFNADFEAVKTGLGLPDAVTPETTFGDAQGMMTVGELFNLDETGIADFIAQYGLDETVTPETQWKDVREKVETVQLEQRLAEEAAEAEETANAEDEVVEAEPEAEDVAEETAE